MSVKYTALTDALYDYMLAQRSNANDPILAALQMETENLGEVSRMSISPDQASLISLLVALIGAKWAVEVGTFTGTSSISIARHLVPSGKLVCFDQDLKSISIARRYWIKAGVQERIDLRLGDARAACWRIFARRIRSILCSSTPTRRATTFISKRYFPMCGRAA